MFRFALFSLLTLLFSLAPIQGLKAGPHGRNSLPSYPRALKDLDKGREGKARILLARGPDVVLNEVILGRLMAQPGNEYAFDELAGFITIHPDWPDLKGIRMIAEQKIPTSFSHKQVINWFKAYSPLTDSGFVRYIDALNATGKENLAIKLVRNRWIEKNFCKKALLAFRSRYAPLLRLKDNRARFNRLLWDGKISSARYMYRFLRKGDKALGKARIALTKNKGRISPLLKGVPKSMQNDAGLLYERMKWRKRHGLYKGVLEILEKPPAKLFRPKAWWRERHIMARRLMEKKRFKRAYHLITKHGLSSTDGFEYLQAEFLAGFLALRLLDQPQKAEKHFNRLTKAANAPVSKARAYYWVGRTHEKLKRKDAAEQAYEVAATFNTTYYGQLAISKLYTSPTIRASSEPTIPSHVRDIFFSHVVIRVTQKLARLGDYKRARRFFMASASYAVNRVEFALLMEIAHMLEKPDWAIKAAKKAAQKGFLLTGAAYPILSIEIPTPPDLAFTHALIRQESLFQADAGSSAGARGLMQLMPATAKGICRKMGISYRRSRLHDPAYNLKLGTYFIQKQIDDFDGSFILALAGYNAGPRRARQWAATFGDPRRARIDPIDWVELLPIYETRNYIQRILENLQFYRARLNGGQARLMIVEDLRR